MKKIISTITILTMLLATTLTVSAAELEQDFVSNMDAESYLTLRLEQIQDALDEGSITAEEADLLIAHITEVAEAQSFGNGPTFGVKGDGNATCILGEESQLGIFRSESAGMRTGNGNGVRQQLSDGSANGNKGTKGSGNNGGRGGNGNRNQGQNSNNEDCVLVTE